MKKKLLIATTTVAIALIASPAFAESDRKDGERFGLNLGSIVREIKKDTKEHRDERRDSKKGDRNATSSVSVRGTVTAVSSTVITLSGMDGEVHTVQAANATFEGGVLADIKVGDTIKVKGTMSGTILVASKIHNKDFTKHFIEARLENLRAGIVTSVSGTGFTLTRLGTGTNATISTNASTVVKVNGQATTTAAITPGALVIAVGSSTGTSTPDTLVGTAIHVITKGFGWLRHALQR